MSPSSPHRTTPATEEPVKVSDWVRVTQEMIDEFGHCTLDPDPMHVDPKWAADGPFGTTISFGFLTMSLLSRLMHAALEVPYARDLSVSGYYLNYGFERVRLITPVKVNSRIRGRFQLIKRRQDEKGRIRSTFHCVIEIEGEERPAMVADWLNFWVPPPSPMQP